MGSDQGFSSGSRRPCGRHGGGQSTVRRSRSVQISSRDSLARSSRALRGLEDRPSAFRPVGKERRFRAHFQDVGERSRQRIHDDRRHYRARPSAQRRGTKKNGEQAIGRSRGGLTTKIHVLVDALGNPVAVMLTPGQAHDLTCAEPLLETVDPRALLGDKAFDADPFIDSLARRGITPVIPPKANRKAPRSCDFALYCERNLVERFFNQLKNFRAVATRSDKLARNFL